jgi:2'-hydroxyisoflavone reductase
MQILVLGGTGFLSRHVAEQAVARGWSVTCVARGRTGPFPDGVQGVTLDRADPDALTPLAATAWDAVVDVTSQPGQVRRAVAAFPGAHYVFVSTINVYAEAPDAPADETAPLLEPLAGDVMHSLDDYGAAKVACEQAAAAADSWTIARAGLIAGPGDRSGRLGYWPRRFAADLDAAVLVPDEPEQPVQLIDARDLATWLLDAAAARTTGAFDLCGDVQPLGDVLTGIRHIVGHRGEVVRADATWLHAHDVRPWMGARSLPLWLGDRAAWPFMQRSNARATATGLRLRPLADTARDTWASATAGSPPPETGLTDAEHAELLEQWRAEHSSPPTDALR